MCAAARPYRTPIENGCNSNGLSLAPLPFLPLACPAEFFVRTAIATAEENGRASSPLQPVPRFQFPHILVGRGVLAPRLVLGAPDRENVLFFSPMREAQSPPNFSPLAPRHGLPCPSNSRRVNMAATNALPCSLWCLLAKHCGRFFFSGLQADGLRRCLDRVGVPQYWRLEPSLLVLLDPRCRPRI